MDFKDRLKKARRRARMTQQELANAIQSHRGSVVRWEAGEDIPTLYTTVRIADALNCAILYLCGIYTTPDRALQLDEQEMRLVKLFRKLDERGRESALEVIGESQATLERHKAKT